MSGTQDVMVSLVNLTEPGILLGNGPLGMTLGTVLIEFMEVGVLTPALEGKFPRKGILGCI